MTKKLLDSKRTIFCFNIINMTSSRFFIKSWTKSGNLWRNILKAMLCFMDTQTMLALKHITCRYHEKGLNLYTAI